MHAAWPAAGVITAGTRLVEQASDFVPASVPRPVAKGGVALLGGLFVFGLVQKVGTAHWDTADTEGMLAELQLYIVESF